MDISLGPMFYGGKKGAVIAKKSKKPLEVTYMEPSCASVLGIGIVIILDCRISFCNLPDSRPDVSDPGLTLYCPGSA